MCVCMCMFSTEVGERLTPPGMESLQTVLEPSCFGHYCPDSLVFLLYVISSVRPGELLEGPETSTEHSLELSPRSCLPFLH